MARPTKPQILPLACKTHGVLPPEEHYLSKQAGRQPSYHCRLCKLRHQKNTYARQGNTQPRKGEHGYERYLHMAKLRKRKQQQLLPDRIVKEKLTRSVGIPKERITKELIEVQRAIIMIRRAQRKWKSIEQLT